MGDSEDEFRELRGGRQERRRRVQPSVAARRHDCRGGRPREAAAEGLEGPGAGGIREPAGRGAPHEPRGDLDGDHDDAARPPPVPPAGREEAPPAQQPQSPEPATAGLVFCQLCQKDLSAMNGRRRQQHVNRCLDDLEKLHPPSSSTPGIPECPICGKGFSTLKSRSSHLKRCAIRMEVPPPLLLQAVRQQASALGSSCPAALRGLKRKVSSLEQAMEQHQTVKTEGLDEDLLVAMAMSRTHPTGREVKAKPPKSGRLDGPSHTRKRLKAERQPREKPPQLPPPLLLQDPEKARKQTEERVALLLAEAEEFPGTPPLPASELLEAEKSRQTRLLLPAGQHCSLWEFSSLTGPCAAPGSFSATGFALPVPVSTDQRPGPSTAGQVVEQVPPGAGCLQGTVCGDLPGSILKPTYSQKDGEALQDLVELAEEGLTLTQWKLDVQQGPQSGQGREPGDVLQSQEIQLLEKELPQRSCHQTAQLCSLAAAFRGMVNNPHLSDLQFQVDSGEVIYAHMFVLYARCPQLMEFVDQRGFLVAEGDVRSRRVLLEDVSGEAVRVFLSHLYAADHGVPLLTLSDVAALALRFGAKDLAALCRGQASGGLYGGEEEEEDGAGRASAFEELLESMWLGENQDAEATLHPEDASNEDVGEQELEEIYEFAATQRKAALSRARSEERGSRGRQRQAARGGTCAREVEVEEPSAGTATSERKGGFDPESLRLHVQHTRREGGARGRLPEPLQDPEETQPFREPETEAALQLAGEDQPQFNESSHSLFSAAQEGSFELFQHSPDTRVPSKDPTAGPSVAPESLTLSSGLLGKLPLPVLSPVPSLPGSSLQGRGALPRKLSQTLAAAPLRSASQPSPAGNKAERATRTQMASSGQALGKGLDRTLDSPALPAPLSHAALEPLDLILLSDSDEEVESGQGQAGASGKEPGLSAAVSGSLRPCVGKEDSEDPLLGARVCWEAAPRQRLSQGSEREDSWAEGFSWSKGEEMLVPDTPLLGRGGSSGTQSAPLSSRSDCEERWTQRTWASQPPARLASVRSPKGSLSPLPWLAGLPGDGKSAQGPPSPLSGPAEVVIVDDSEEEQDAAPPLSWDSRVLGEELPALEGESSCLLPGAGPKRVAAYSGLSRTPPRGLGKRDGSPLARTAALHLGEGDVSESRCRGGAAWDGGDSSEEDVFPLTQRLSATQPVQKTPELAFRTKEVPCAIPQTPLPSYSIMETPELKKELSRFGVRALPKRQMVLKLKEIFQYTHQGKGADPQPKATSSQPALRCSRAKAVRRAPRPAVTSSTPHKHPSRTAGPLQGGQNGSRRRGLPGAGAGGLGQAAEVHCLQRGARRPKGAALSPAKLPGTDPDIGTDGPALTASQESVESSVSGSDASLVSRSSSTTEFEASVLAEEEEEEEGISASQTAAREADKLAALQRYIRSKPALHRQILLYQPFELAGLQAELKQNGIRMALGKLLDFLDAHCITFTTAEARREKQQRSKRRGRKRF